MTFQISTCKLLKQEIRQNNWLIGLTTLLHLLTGPVICLLAISSGVYLGGIAGPASQLYNILESVYFPLQLGTMIACITMCISIYRYLFSAKMVDLYHSVPISRGQLFWVKYLHGLLVWLLPFLVSYLAVALLFLSRTVGAVGFMDMLAKLLQYLFMILLCYFILYHLFLVAVFLSGNILNMFANVAIIGLSIWGLWYMFFAFASYSFQTYCYNPPNIMWDLALSLSPFATPFGIWLFFNQNTLFTDHLLLLALSLLVCILCLAAARYLYGIRPSELAERGTISKYYTIPARILTAFLLGIIGAYIFSNFAGMDGALIWGLFGVLLCTFLSIGFLNSIFEATIKSFFKHKRTLLLTSCCGIFFVLTFQLDLFGYDEYLPAKEDIAGISIYAYHLTDNSAEYTLTDNHLLAQMENTNELVLQELFFTDKELCYDLLNTFIYTAPTDIYTSSWNNYYAKIQLENGYTYTRYYALPDSMSEKITPFIEHEAYKNTNYKLSTGALGYPYKLEYSLWDNAISVKADNNVTKELMDAYWADFEEHYTLTELTSQLLVGKLHLSYHFAEPDGLTRNFTLRIPDNYTRTIALLETLQPDYLPAFQGPEEIEELYLYVHGLEANLDPLDALYQYFGYTGHTATSNSPADTYIPIDELASFTNASTTSKQSIVLEESYPTLQYMEIKLTNTADIAELYPYLYFGDYRDILNSKEYINLGHLITTMDYSINLLVKPGTLPEKYIQMLYEARVEE